MLDGWGRIGFEETVVIDGFGECKSIMNYAQSKCMRYVRIILSLTNYDPRNRSPGNFSRPCAT